MDITTLIATVTQATVEAQILGYAQGSELKVTSWARGSAAQQLIVLFSRALVVLYAIVQQCAKALFLDTATDPGDDDGQPEAKGFLSYKGEGDFGTTRALSTYASGEVTFTNNSGATVEFGPEELEFENTITQKTYRNTYDADLYGTERVLVVANGASVDIPIQALEAGTGSNATAGDIVMTTTIAGCSATNAASVLGQDRQSAAKYRELCRLASGALSPNGPAEAYKWIAQNLNTDGTLALPDDGKTRLNVTRVRTSNESLTGAVQAWFASPSGPVDAGEFTTLETALARFATPDGVTPTFTNCSAITVNITYTASARNGDATDVEEAIEDYLTEWFPTIPISGFDFNGTSGFLELDTLKIAIGRGGAAYEVYDVNITVPASNQTYGAAQVPVLGTVSGTVTIVD